MKPELPGPLLPSLKAWPMSRLLASNEFALTCDPWPNSTPLRFSTTTIPSALIWPRISEPLAFGSTTRLTATQSFCATVPTFWSICSVVWAPMSNLSHDRIARESCCVICTKVVLPVTDSVGRLAPCQVARPVRSALAVTPLTRPSASASSAAAWVGSPAARRSAARARSAIAWRTAAMATRPPSLVRAKVPSPRRRSTASPFTTDCATATFACVANVRICWARVCAATCRSSAPVWAALRICPGTAPGRIVGAVSGEPRTAASWPNADWGNELIRTASTAPLTDRNRAGRTAPRAPVPRAPAPWVGRSDIEQSPLKSRIAIMVAIRLIETRG